VSTQPPLHAVRPVGHAAAQAPAAHTSPLAQTLPQAPQFWGSAVVSRQTPPQEVFPASQVHPPAPHAPEAPHEVKQLPQCSGSDERSTQGPAPGPPSTPAAPQSVNPTGQRHFPPLQAKPPLHDAPQPPQFKGSVDRSMQLCPHVENGLLHVATQVPFWQNGEEPVHAFPQVPQLAGSASRDRHVPPQVSVPAGHWQAPPTQFFPAVQPWPHAPQFEGSLAKRTHASPHAVCPGAGHVQTPPRHASAGPHWVEHDPQWMGSEAVSTQAAPQTSSPDAHEALPQLAGSVQIPPHRI
jgi:hypothetical protein